MIPDTRSLAILIGLIRHLQGRMAQHGISRNKIEQVLQNPEITYRSDSEQGLIVLLGTCQPGARRLKVAVLASDRSSS